LWAAVVPVVSLAPLVMVALEAAVLAGSAQERL